MANSEKTYQHWIEIVRTFRTYYDHLRIAFPHMHQIPKYFSEEWASEFRLSAREFARKEDMEAVKRLFDGAGYGTERWENLTALPPESIAAVLSQGSPPNGSPIAIDAPSKDEDVLRSVREALGVARFDRLLEDPAAFARELDRLESEESDDDEAVEAGPAEIEVEIEPEVEVEPEVLAVQEAAPDVVEEATEESGIDAAAPEAEVDETTRSPDRRSG